MIKPLLSVFSVSIACCGFAETLGFWDFRDGNAGDDVTTVANSAGTGSFTSDTAKKSNGSTGVLPKFNADSPGRIWSGKRGELLCANPQSIDFRYVSRSSRNGGYIDLNGVADAISGKGSFTIEYFFKMDKDYDYYKEGDAPFANWSKTMLYLESRTGYGAFKVITPNTTVDTRGKDVKLEVYKHDPVADGYGSFSSDLGSNTWHHVAVVYAETNVTTKAGKMVFYYDGAHTADIPYLNDPGESTGLKLRIGTGYKNQNGEDKTSTEAVNATISALRVSNVALGVDDFLQADTLPDISELKTAAYYTFKDGAVGDVVDTVANAVDPEIMMGVAGVTWDGSTATGEKPKFSSEVPSQCVYTDSALTNVLTKDYQSVYFRPVQDYSMGGGKIDFTAGSTIAHRLDAFTFEYFFKIPADQTHIYRSPFGYMFGEREDLKMNLYGYSADVGFVSYKCEVRTNTTSGVTTYSSTEKSGANLRSTWHHAAFVYNKKSSSVDVYLDRIKCGSVYYTNRLATISKPFRLGSSALDAKSITEACGGYFACPRLTTSALSADQFMVASELPQGSVFAVNFNDGEGKNGQTFVSGNTATSNKALTPAGAEYMTVKYGLHSAAYPQFAEGNAVRAGRMIQWGTETVWENLAGCHFLGYGSLTNGTPNRQYAGTELCVAGSEDAYRNPTNWTMEAFVKPEYDNLDGAHLFGKGAVADQHAKPTPYPRYCWMLTRNKDGRLVLFWTEQATESGFEYTDKTTDYYNSVTTTNPVLKDKCWHHVALTYDKPTKTFKLYVNYQLVLTQATSGRELLDSTHDYYFSRMSASYGFEGWMDEIRFSDSALEPAQFIHLQPLGSCLLFY